MPMYATWQSRPVFITSTFRDMQAERDYLRGRVFPELEERLRRRHHFLEPIDLRWGVQTIPVSEQHTKELLMLKVCLAEIARSRPFLIALVGDRYGWVPPEERLRTATAEEGYQILFPEPGIEQELWGRFAGVPFGSDGLVARSSCL
ncbi:MAG: DUF4062 domain-containing protein [Bryobacteraceae bacterium]